MDRQRGPVRLERDGLDGDHVGEPEDERSLDVFPYQRRLLGGVDHGDPRGLDDHLVDRLEEVFGRHAVHRRRHRPGVGAEGGRTEDVLVGDHSLGIPVPETLEVGDGAKSGPQTNAVDGRQHDGVEA